MFVLVSVLGGLRRTVSGGTVDLHPAGTVHHQNVEVRSLWENYQEICLKMNWFHCVRR